MTRIYRNTAGGVNYIIAKAFNRKGRKGTSAKVAREAETLGIREKLRQPLGAAFFSNPAYH
jgi:hypothetical protein